MGRECGGLRETSWAVRLGRESQPWRRAVSRVEMAGEPRERWAYATKDASLRLWTGGETGAIWRAVDGGLEWERGGGMWIDHKFSWRSLEPSRKGRAEEGEKS